MSFDHYDNRIFSNDCAGIKGWSGGPILMQWQGELYVIGLIVNGATAKPADPRDIPNFAVRLHGEFYSALERIRSNGAGALDDFGQRHLSFQ